MPNTFLISDTHFGQQSICSFTRDDGSPLRPWSCVKEMDEALVERWNSVVRAKDKVYHLGDVVSNRHSLKILGRLAGEKILIKGNHDIFKPNEYLQYFKDIRAYHILNGLALSHIPVHPDSLRRFGCNIHGHLHYRRVEKDGEIDPLYYSVCVENHNYTPISLEDVYSAIRAQGGHVGFRETGPAHQAD